jgi:hypothetical protein
MDDVVVIPKVQRLTSAYHFRPTAECCQWFGLWRRTPLSAIFQLYHGDQFY